MKPMVKYAVLLLVAGMVMGSLPKAAAAHGGGWGVGIGVGLGPVILPGPYYYPPPVYYPPPPAYYAPPPLPPGYYSPYPGFMAQSPSPPAQQAPARSSAGGMATSCNAGDYVCPMEASVPAGARCYCRGNDGERVYGVAQ